MKSKECGHHETLWPQDLHEVQIVWRHETLWELACQR